ncbi:hypothetical protein [uncultured Maribacter sp.]|uniref:hypothetical protein n=1 Tax=uncultured Maribacter sp. TaxID=431308 RepID=UPI002617F5B3|nr:hypothetical protein [uncultured Maribacter sp.]
MKPKNNQTVSKLIFKSILGMLFLMLFVNCSKNPIKCLNGSWAQDVASDLEAWTDASNRYAENPTVENCNSYKGALNNYINALEDVEDCYGGLADFDGDFDDAKEELNDIDCTEN